MTALRQGTARTVDCSFKIKLLSATLAQRVGVGGLIVREHLTTSRIRGPQAACVGASSKRRFPPFSAGASLKRYIEQLIVSGIRCFPPFSAGASLKPGHPGLDARRGPGFPPFSAGASLKPSCGTRQKHWNLRFPPFSAGASLKPVQRHGHPVDVQVVFPRFLRGPH